MKRLFISFAALGTLGMAGCKKEFLDINQDPNRATFSTPQLTMPYALEGAARVSQQSYTPLGWWMGMYGGSAGFSKPNVEYTYDVNSSFMGGVWDNLFDNITDFDYIEKSAKQKNLPVYEAIAKVMKAYDYHQLVDLWGNVPYSDALKGVGNFAPGYDDGKTVYEDLVKKLDSAIAIFKKPSTIGSVNVAEDGTRIIMFNDVLKSDGVEAFLNHWVKFTNTLKLKLLVQQSNVPGRDAYIKAELAGLTRADFLDLGEDALANPGYANDPTKFNPYYSVWFSNINTFSDTYKSTKAGDFAVDLLNETNDPRRLFYYYKGNATSYIGSELGDPVGASGASNINGNGGGILEPDASAVIMIASESLFLQAEAVQRGYLNGNAQRLYEDAVLASFEYCKVPNAASAAAAYVAQNDPNANWSLATDKIKLIITQKYLALSYIDILAVYNDYRRTGFPNIPLSIDANSKGKVPVRLAYPQREIQLNGSSVTAQGDVNPLTTTVFWDK